YWHAFLDGRDVPPRSAAKILRDLGTKLKQIGVGRIATVVGRYYAMDRDQRWERVERAYNLMVRGEGRAVEDPAAAVEEGYRSDETDEFVKPIVVTEGGRPVATVSDGDSVVFFNFRSDRAREITRALAGLEVGFDRNHLPKLSSYVCMTEYDARFGLP